MSRSQSKPSARKPTRPGAGEPRDAAGRTFRSLDRTLRTVQDECDDLRRQNAGYVQTNAAQVETIRALQKRRDELAIDADTARAQREMAETAHRRAVEQIARIERVSATEIAGLQLQLARAHSDIDTLERRIAVLKAASDERAHDDGVKRRWTHRMDLDALRRQDEVGHLFPEPATRTEPFGGDFNAAREAGQMTERDRDAAAYSRALERLCAEQGEYFAQSISGDAAAKANGGRHG